MRKPNLWKAGAVALAIFLSGLFIRFMIWEHYLGPIAVRPQQRRSFRNSVLGNDLLPDLLPP